MEEILNKIIEIDKNAKAIVKEENERKLNIEEVIEKEFDTAKVVLDLEFKDEITKRKDEKKFQLEQEKAKIDSKLQTQIDKLKNEYIGKEKQIVENIVNSIKSGEN